MVYSQKGFCALSSKSLFSWETAIKDYEPSEWEGKKLVGFTTSRASTLFWTFAYQYNKKKEKKMTLKSDEGLWRSPWFQQHMWYG